MVTERLADREAFAHWFGNFTTTRKYPDMDWQPEVPIEVAHLGELLASGLALLRNPASRFSFVRGKAGAVILFVDGESYHCGEEVARFAELLCAHDLIKADAAVVASDSAMALIAKLYNQGSVAFETED